MEPQVFNAIIALCGALIAVCFWPVVAWFKKCAAEEAERKRHRPKDDDQYPPVRGPW